MDVSAGQFMASIFQSNSWHVGSSSDEFSQSLRKEDDVEALKWAALEKLPPYDLIQKGILTEAVREKMEVKVENLSLHQWKKLMERLLWGVDDVEALKSSKPPSRPFGSGPPDNRPRGPPRFEGDRSRFGYRDEYHGGPRGGGGGGGGGFGDKGGAHAEFQPTFGEQAIMRIHRIGQKRQVCVR